jgi:hypothetical protein
VGYKLTKNDAKMIIYNAVHGGVENHQILPFLDLGTSDPPKHKFFEIPHFFAKTLHFRTPKIDPYKWPYKFSIPHKNACTFAPMGVEKCHFLGGRGADRSDRKM